MAPRTQANTAEKAAASTQQQKSLDKLNLPKVKQALADLSNYEKAPAAQKAAVKETVKTAALSPQQKTTLEALKKLGEKGAYTDAGPDYEGLA